jgi:23S rRNA pseudouridine2605 synthase
MPLERLQKLLSRAGYGSRRHCETLIQAGRVVVNGDVAKIGSKADPSKDKIFVDGKLISIQNEKIYIALNKPRGVLSTVRTKDDRRTVRDLVEIDAYIYPVGRLDIDSEGLMLLTNDGELANRLTHPRYGHEKEYRVLVSRRPDEKQIQSWRRGIILSDGYRTASAKVMVESQSSKGTWLRIIMREGRKRQIREVGILLGLPVKKIIRVRIGTLKLGKLKRGEWRSLSTSEISSLLKNK